MAIVDLVMPKLGESIMEATILKWHKRPGDAVAMDETVLEIATDKVDSEVPSTAAGVLSEILFNVNDVVPEYLITGKMEPRPSKQTISNAMDVGNPSNFARLMDLYGGALGEIRNDIEGYAFTDEDTSAAMRMVWQRFNYMLDPHGAIGYLGLKKYLSAHPGNVNGIFLETAHPAKFTDVVENAIGESVPLPETRQKFVNGKKESVVVEKEYPAFKSALLRTLRG